MENNKKINIDADLENEIVDKLINSYPFILKFVVNVNLNIIGLLQFLNEEGLYQMIADDEESKEKLNTYIDKHQELVSGIEELIRSALYVPKLDNEEVDPK